MLTTPLAAAVFAYHGTESAGNTNPMVLVIFVAAVATAAWVLFSQLSWRNTMMVTVAGWLVLLALTFAF